jgi:methyl-accepting chemotaxis protein
MNAVSLKTKLILLAFFPVFILASVLISKAYFSAQNEAESRVKHLRDSLYAERKQQLDTLLEMAGTAISSASDENSKKAILRSLRYENGKNYFFVYDLQGVQVVSADQPEREGKNFLDSKSAEGRYLVKEYIEAAKKGGDYINYNWPKPGSTVAAPKLAKAIMLGDWVLATGFYIDDLEQLIQQQREATEQQIYSGLLQNALITLVLVSLVIFVGTLFAKAILNPLLSVVQAMQDIGSGEADLTKRLDASMGHELGALAQAFNQFSGKVATLVGQVQSSMRSLGQSAEHLASLMQKTEAGVAQQHSESDQVATAINEMSATAEDVAKSASQAAQAANHAETQVHEANAKLHRAISVIGGLEQQVQVGVSVIDKVGDDSRNIGAVLDVIRSIADQTNLLALNAAIEAARAGEHGRGFAVVADEVRTLAARTAKSTDEINQMIVSLQQGAEQAVQAINEIKHHSQNTVQQAQLVDAALQEIQQSVSTINDMNNQIASAAEEQTTVSEMINKNVHQIVVIAQETSSDTSASAAISKELMHLSDQLNAEVCRYKI